jgi:phosphoglycerol transferase MdoB-like AlkP superfamily enzyme
MESYDAWPLLKKYESLGLTSSLKDLARRGIHVESFLPSSDGTMSSLTAIISGLPYTGLEINYQDTSRKTYPSSLAEAFKRLGYKTRFFYGGYLSWQKAGDFARAQGFDELYGAGHMSSWTSIHEWGLEDEYLFDFVAKTVDDARPSFNFILTTSYHPPYKIDVRGKGFPLKKLPDDLAPLFDGRVDLNMLGHLWYADHCIGAFVQNEEKKLHGAVFAFTGDHYGRKFFNAKPDFFERSAVPLILYGKDVLRGVSLPKGAAGSHIDIAPTLIELAAPKGFAYYAVGNNLLAPRSHALGIGWGKMIGPDFIFSVADEKMYPLPFRPLPRKPPAVHDLKELFNTTYGIGWWRVKQGPAL